MQKTFGTGAATNSIDDLKDTHTIMVIGANPTDAHPVTGAKIKQQIMKGKTLIVIDPRRTELARYAKYHLQLKPRHQRGPAQHDDALHREARAG
jgi:formate dehydrogenase major subunit